MKVARSWVPVLVLLHAADGFVPHHQLLRPQYAAPALIRSVGCCIRTRAARLLAMAPLDLAYVVEAPWQLRPDHPATQHPKIAGISDTAPDHLLAEHACTSKFQGVGRVVS